ncbi:MAG: OB-fold nucleic acid binding domain-containing protein [Nanoarchaeota archaeon]|nr:OB-fold nucleic acid binding domain-containing protein [Nanoarchaeota archaeon]
MPELKKRETAYKLRIIDLLRGNQIFEESNELNKRLKFLELGNKKIVRINIMGNVVDKYESEGERRFATLTLDDGSGQIRIRVFGYEVSRFSDISYGDTLLVIGVLRFFNNELYILPELIKKHDSRYLLVRKLEIEKALKFNNYQPKKQEIKALREEVIDLIKISEEREGIDKDEIIMKIKAEPELISQEIQKLLEEGIAYEPRPGRVRYLG